MPNEASPKTARLSLRMTPQAKAMLQQAAKARHKTLSEFVLDQSLAAAEETRADRHQFVLDDAQWAELNRLLDAPPRDMPKLHELAQRKPRWS